MFARIRTYLTLACTLLLPLLVMAWVRSYIANDTVIRVGNGRAVLVDSIRGEVSVWIAAAPDRTTVYDHETIAAQDGWTAREIFEGRPSWPQRFALGFGKAEAPAFPSGIRPPSGTVNCYVVPMWFLAVVIGYLPVRLLLRHTRLSDPESEAEADGATVSKYPSNIGAPSSKRTPDPDDVSPAPPPRPLPDSKTPSYPGYPHRARMMRRTPSRYA